jgi:hypothetical protein
VRQFRGALDAGARIMRDKYSPMISLLHCLFVYHYHFLWVALILFTALQTSILCRQPSSFSIHSHVPLVQLGRQAPSPLISGPHGMPYWNTDGSVEGHCSHLDFHMTLTRKSVHKAEEQIERHLVTFERRRELHGSMAGPRSPCTPYPSHSYCRLCQMLASAGKGA